MSRSGRRFAGHRPARCLVGIVYRPDHESRSIIGMTFRDRDPKL